MANIKISELNALTERADNDLLAIVDTSADETKKIQVSDLVNKNIELIAVSDTAPSECSIGDKYYNTTDKEIYTATGTNTWSETGTTPISGILYIVYNDQASYSWDGSDLVSVGGGKEDIVIDDEEPTDPDVKLWIDTGEIQNSGSEIESGSNENGNWIKFADGTMVCYGNVSLTIPIATAISPIGGYRNTGGTNTKVFPQPFYEIPIVNTQVVLYTATQSYAHNITTSGFDLFFTTISSDNTNTERKASYIAIGRWKA